MFDPASWNNHGSIECFNGKWYVFYHRCSRGVQQYRRLCIEPIKINSDGSIDEVKMTSQGPGEPFAPGEKIMGYQACGVKGGCFIGCDDVYIEKLMNISAGNEAVFRYIKSKNEWKMINVTYSGSGKIKIVFLDSKNEEHKIEAGTITAQNTNGEIQTIRSTINAPAGEYELVFIFEESNKLEIFEISIE